MLEPSSITRRTEKEHLLPLTHHSYSSLLLITHTRSRYRWCLLWYSPCYLPEKHQSASPDRETHRHTNTQTHKHAHNTTQHGNLGMSPHHVICPVLQTYQPVHRLSTIQLPFPAESSTDTNPYNRLHTRIHTRITSGHTQTAQQRLAERTAD